MAPFNICNAFALVFCKAHMTRKFSVLLVLFGSTLLTNIASAQELNVELFERFKHDAPIAWKKVKEANLTFSKTSNGLTASMEARGYTLTNDKRAFKSKNVRKILDRSHRMNTNSFYSDDDVLICINPKYAYELKRKTGTTNWSLLNVVDLSPPPKGIFSNETWREHTEMLDRSFVKTLRDFPCGDGAEKTICFPEIFPNDHKIENIFTLKNLAFQKCYWTEFKGTKCVAIEVVYSTTGLQTENGSKKVVDKPAVLFAMYDPDNFWALRYARSELDKASFLGQSVFGGEISCEYDVGILGTPRLKSSTLARWNTDCKDDPAILSSEYTAVEESLKHEDFYLTAFGFPEPNFKRPWPPYLTYISFFGIALFAGIVVRHWVRRNLASRNEPKKC